MLRRIIYILIIILIPISSIAQYQLTTKNSKAIKSYNEALASFNRMDYTSAIELMNKALKADDKFIEAYLVLAEIYIESGNTLLAIEAYNNAIQINPDFFPEMYFSLAQLEMKSNKFVDAKMHIENYLANKNAKPELKPRAKHLIKTCEFAIDAIKNPVPFNPENIGDSVNTEYDEYWPSLTADEQMLIITRLVPKNTNPQNQMQINTNNPFHRNFQEDFYISLKVDKFWTKTMNAGKPLNTSGNEGAQSISVDGKLMYFTACNRSDGKGRCDIYLSKVNPEGWSEPVNIGSPVNSEYWEAQPSISPDGKTLFFVSNREGGIGKKDIWYSTLRDDNTWSVPVNLGENINTSNDEQSPFIHSDNNTLFFASEGRIGMGGFDLYKSTRNDDGTWSEAINIGYPINTVNDEIGLIVNAKGDKAIFSSDRLSDKGRDIFQFELYKEARPQAVSYMKGVVFDKDNKKKLKAHFELINLETKKLIMKAESDERTGEFLVCIPTNNDYALNVSKEGYLFYSDNFTLKGVFEISDPFLKDIGLSAIKVGQKIVLKNIFFKTDSFELNARSLVELSKLVEFLNNNSNIKIEISGHTDNIGEIEYNQLLSENRAKSVYEYLLKQGIGAERLKYKGYGESLPINTNDTDEGRAENRRTEIKILSFE